MDYSLVAFLIPIAQFLFWYHCGTSETPHPLEPFGHCQADVQGATLFDQIMKLAISGLVTFFWYSAYGLIWFCSIITLFIKEHCMIPINLGLLLLKPLGFLSEDELNLVMYDDDGIWLVMHPYLGDLSQEVYFFVSRTLAILAVFLISSPLTIFVYNRWIKGTSKLFYRQLRTQFTSFKGIANSFLDITQQTRESCYSFPGDIHPILPGIERFVEAAAKTSRPACRHASVALSEDSCSSDEEYHVEKAPSSTSLNDAASGTVVKSAHRKLALDHEDDSLFWQQKRDTSYIFAVPENPRNFSRPAAPILPVSLNPTKKRDHPWHVIKPLPTRKMVEKSGVEPTSSPSAFCSGSKVSLRDSNSTYHCDRAPSMAPLRPVKLRSTIPIGSDSGSAPLNLGSTKNATSVTLPSDSPSSTSTSSTSGSRFPPLFGSSTLLFSITPSPTVASPVQGSSTATKITFPIPSTSASLLSKSQDPVITEAVQLLRGPAFSENLHSHPTYAQMENPAKQVVEQVDIDMIYVPPPSLTTTNSWLPTGFHSKPLIINYESSDDDSVHSVSSWYFDENVMDIDSTVKPRDDDMDEDLPQQHVHQVDMEVDVGEVDMEVDVGEEDMEVDVGEEDTMATFQTDKPVNNSSSAEQIVEQESPANSFQTLTDPPQEFSMSVAPALESMLVTESRPIFPAEISSNSSDLIEKARFSKASPSADPPKSVVNNTPPAQPKEKYIAPVETNALLKDGSSPKPIATSIPRSTQTPPTQIASTSKLSQPAQNPSPPLAELNLASQVRSGPVSSVIGANSSAQHKQVAEPSRRSRERGIHGRVVRKSPQKAKATGPSSLRQTISPATGINSASAGSSKPISPPPSDSIGKSTESRDLSLASPLAMLPQADKTSSSIGPSASSGSMRQPNVPTGSNSVKGKRRNGGYFKPCALIPPPTINRSKEVEEETDPEEEAELQRLLKQML